MSSIDTASGRAADVLAHGLESARSLPPLTPDRWLTTWEVEPQVAAVLAVAAAAYVTGVVRLRRRGVPWGNGRVVLWMLGLLVILAGTSSSVGVYDGALFSAHAIQHMFLQMLAPVPLALAAPITLALRALRPPRRRLLLRVLHSPVAVFLTRPLVAFALFAFSPFVLYYTPLYEATLRNDWLHNLNHAHYVMLGFLLFSVLLGLDPLPHRMPYTYRLFLLFALGPIHVLLGVPIMMGSDVFALEYYTELGRTWGPTLVEDQQTGGGLLWVFGDVVVIAFLAGMFGQWLRSDDRDARRTDRDLDRRFGDGATMPVPWADSTR